MGTSSRAPHGPAPGGARGPEPHAPAFGGLHRLVEIALQAGERGGGHRLGSARIAEGLGFVR
jgi:hypothetical protein